MNIQTGIVFRSTGGQNTVKLDISGHVVECSVKGKLRLKGIRTTNPVVVGDHVKAEINASLTSGNIIEIIERKNYIIRRSTNLSKECQILASNIDQLFIVATVASPPTSLMFIDRLLITAEAYNITAIIILNKIDLYEGEMLEKVGEYAAIYEHSGYKCLFTSVLKNIGINDLKQLMQGKTNIFAGHSGVGKSSLTNWVYPQAGAKTGTISDSHKKGKHTTTFASMVEIGNGTYLIDTPGVKSFGLLDIDPEELSHYFPEIFKASQKCRFHNCTHNTEPDCNVIKEVMAGNISMSRYKNYLDILLDKEDSKYRFDDYSQ